MSSDGGPAFPQRGGVKQYRDVGGNFCTGQFADSNGMTMRDYFASHSGITLQDAMEWYTVAYPHHEPVGQSLIQALAILRYMHADAMLKERERTNTKEKVND